VRARGDRGPCASAPEGRARRAHLSPRGLRPRPGSRAGAIRRLCRSVWRWRMSDDALAKVADGRAWTEFCELLRKAGDVIRRDDLELTAFDRAEGLRYLSRLLAAGLSSFVEA